MPQDYISKHLINGEQYKEYPFHPPEHVFNGFMFAILGLHDYYMISHDPNCATVIKGSLTTVTEYFDQWRVPGGVSYYCLRHKHTDPNYQPLVIALLRQLCVISGDSTFNSFADSLYADYH